MSILTEEVVFAALEAERNGVLFPVDFEEAWKNAGYRRKNNAKRSLLNELIEGEDYIIATAWDLLQGGSTKLTDRSFLSNLSTIRDLVKNVEKITPNEKAALMKLEIIKLSPDGLDHFCLMAQTEEGREARKLFIQYKKAYLLHLERSLFSTPDPELEQLRQKVAELEKLVVELSSKEPEASPEQLETLKTISRMTDNTLYEFTLKAAVQVSGHRDYYDVRQRVEHYLIEELDYRVEGSDLRLSNPAYYAFIAGSRAKDGVDVSCLDKFLHVRWVTYCRVCRAMRLPKGQTQSVSPKNAYYAQPRPPEKQKHPENETKIPGFDW